MSLANCLGRPSSIALWLSPSETIEPLSCCDVVRHASQIDSQSILYRHESQGSCYSLLQGFLFHQLRTRGSRKCTVIQSKNAPVISHVSHDRLMKAQTFSDIVLSASLSKMAMNSAMRTTTSTPTQKNRQPSLRLDIGASSSRSNCFVVVSLDTKLGSVTTTHLGSSC